MSSISWNMIFKEFKQNQPSLIKKLSYWNPYDHLKIKVKLIDGTEIIYDYLTKKSWVYSPEPEEVERKIFMDEREWREGFAERLIDIMEGEGMTQKELADAIEASERTIRMYKHCDRTPSAYVVYRMCEVLGCNPSELINFD